MELKIGQFKVFVSDKLFHLDFSAGETPVYIHLSTPTSNSPSYSLAVKVGELKIDLQIPLGE